MFIKIARIGNSAPIELAANELLSYLSRMDARHDYGVLCYNEYKPEYKDMLWVGIDDSLSTPNVDNSELDDAVSIKVSGGCGYITGTNERSVLIAVYRYLRELGCSFLRPGDKGEIVPKIDLTKTEVSVFEAASYRHRAVCIEGAVDYKDVSSLVAWLPKAGMNGFYNQFRVPYVFYDRWYIHKGNEDKYDIYKLSVSDAEGLMNQTVSELKKRGMLYHAVGHGWTCEPFGIEALGWYDYHEELDDDIKRNFAMVDGKRELWKGVPMNTNLCYSSDKVRDVMSTAVAEYSAAHPEIDYMHVWLADGTNNHCECDECRKQRPSDFYVKLLNDIDKKLTEAGLSTRIVFLIYVDLLWAPIKERLNNPNRFVLMFAPITRTYSSGMAECEPFEGELADYNRNHNDMPSSVSENIEHLKNWQKQFEGDSFDFDYHYMWDHFKDIGNIKIAKVLFDDMKNLDKIGLNGMVSCQCVRAFFPHGLGMNAMAAALWDKTTDFDTVVKNYFSAAFGKDADKVCEYMKKLSDLSDPVFVRGEYESADWASLVPKFQQAKALVDEFEPVIKANLNNSDEAVALSYFHLLYHAGLARLYLDWEIKLACGDTDGADNALEQLKKYSKDHEKELRRVFDDYVFSRTMDKCVKKLLSKMQQD